MRDMLKPLPDQGRDSRADRIHLFEYQAGRGLPSPILSRRKSMTFPSLRKLLLVVPVFIGVGIAVACGPTPTTSCLPAQNGVYYYEPITNAQGQTYYAPRFAPTATPPGAPGTNLSIVDGKLHLLGMDGSKMTCEKFTILVNGVAPAEVTVNDKLIKITSGSDIKDGTFLQATALRASRSGPDGAVVTLQGDAKLVYVRKGKKLEASAEAISVNLATGQIVSEMGVMPAGEDCGPRPSTPPSTAPCTPYSVTGGGSEPVYEAPRRTEPRSVPSPRP